MHSTHLDGDKDAMVGLVQGGRVDVVVHGQSEAVWVVELVGASKHQVSLAVQQ